MLIKDPYLGSQIKNKSFYTLQQKKVAEFTQNDDKPKFQYQSQPFKKPQDKKDTVYTYERQIRSLSEAYKNQEQAFKKLANVQYISKQYNQAIKKRNFQLNTKLNGLTYEKSLLAQKHQEQMLRNSHDKDLILRKYEDQNDQIIRLKRCNSELLEQKARLQSEIDHLMFLMQKDNHQGSLEIKEQLIRMENMQRTLKGIIDTKDAEIVQLRHKVKIYEDQNRRLNDLNRTLTITKQQKIQNLSNISHLDSNIKSHNKENIDANRRDDLLISELNQQKEVNKQLLSEIMLMKKKLFEEPAQKLGKKVLVDKKEDLQQKSINQKMSRLSEIRKNINEKVYEVYCKSVKQGEREKKNSLLLFIQNYKRSTVKQQFGQINEYISLREQIKTIYKSSTNEQIRSRIQIQLPMKLNFRQHNNENEWVLSTMQLTKNQRNESDGNGKNVDQGNNLILFLFRLLTIEYRTKNVTEGKKIQLQKDVQNQLLHSIVKATQSVIQLS